MQWKDSHKKCSEKFLTKSAAKSFSQIVQRKVSHKQCNEVLHKNCTKVFWFSHDSLVMSVVDECPVIILKHWNVENENVEV